MAGEAANLNCGAQPNFSALDWQLHLCQPSCGRGFAAQLLCSARCDGACRQSCPCAGWKLHSPGNLHTFVIAEMSHFVSNGDGLVVTVDSESGDVLWIQNYASPVVAFYIWQREGLRKVLHTNVGIETLRYLTFMSGEVGHITKWKYPFPKETETKSKLTWARHSAVLTARLTALSLNRTVKGCATSCNMVKRMHKSISSSPGVLLYNIWSSACKVRDQTKKFINLGPKFYQMFCVE